MAIPQGPINPATAIGAAMATLADHAGLRMVRKNVFDLHFPISCSITLLFFLAVPTLCRQRFADFYFGLFVLFCSRVLRRCCWYSRNRPDLMQVLLQARRQRQQVAWAPLFCFPTEIQTS